MLTGDFIPPGYVGSSGTLLVLVGLLGLAWGVLIVGFLVTARRLARLQAHENATMHERAARPLSAGPSRVVFGRVEVDGEPIAVEVDVEQRVVDHTAKSSRWHDWQEQSRRSVARPFRLARADGQAVLVEPGEDVLVVDSLATSYPNDKPRIRVRSAVVRADEDVYVYGDLHGSLGSGAYRGGSAFTLRPPRGGRLLVATEAMHDRYRARVRYLRRWGVGMAALFTLLHVAVTRPFLDAALFGREGTAVVTNARTYTTSSKHGPIAHFVVTAKAGDGLVVSSEVQPGIYYEASEAIHARRTLTVPILRSASDSYLGTEPSVHIVALILGLAVASLLSIIAVVRYDARFAWYDRKSVSEDGGSGHWVETRNARGDGPPIDPSRA